MSVPLIVTQLLLKKAEVEAQIASLNDRLTEAKADLFHVVAAVRLFDPTAFAGTPSAYHGVTKALKRSDIAALCRAALEASPEPLDTRQLARHVITAQGWSPDDRRLYLAISSKVGNALGKLALRGIVEKAGTRSQAILWRLKPKGSAR